MRRPFRILVLAFVMFVLGFALGEHAGRQDTDRQVATLKADLAVTSRQAEDAGDQLAAKYGDEMEAWEKQYGPSASDSIAK